MADAVKKVPSSELPTRTISGGSAGSQGSGTKVPAKVVTNRLPIPLDDATAITLWWGISVLFYYLWHIGIPETDTIRLAELLTGCIFTAIWLVLLIIYIPTRKKMRAIIEAGELSEAEKAKGFEMRDFDIAGIQQALNKEVPKEEDSPKKSASTTRAQEARQEVSMDEHIIPFADLFKRYEGSEEKGLSQATITGRQEKEGKNLITPPKATPLWLMLLHELTNIFALLLWGAGALCFLAYILDNTMTDYLYLGVVLWFVNISTGLLGFYQNKQSSDAMAALKKLASDRCTVKRDGVLTQIDAADLCRGDLVNLMAGERIPADVRMLKSVNFQVDNSSLTGEPLPIKLGLDCVLEAPLEAKNLGFSGSLAVNGECTGIVVAIGDHTVIGRIASLVLETTNELTTLEIEVNHFIKFVSTIALGLGLLFFIIGMIRFEGDMLPRITYNIVFAIGIIVANVPEGLLTTVTVSLTLTAMRLKTKKVMVKNLQTVETLGSCSCICSDKTGTLTENRMTASNVWTDGKIVNVTPGAEGTVEYTTKSQTYAQLQRCAAICNDAEFDKDPENMSKPILHRACVNGNATDFGMLKFADMDPNTPQVEELRKGLPICGAGTPFTARLPFSSKYKFMLCVVEGPDGPLELSKGAPEQLLERCSHIMIDGEAVPLDAERRKSFETANAELAGLGERVIGFAQQTLDATRYPKGYEWNTDFEAANFPLTGFCFLGVISLVDPARQGVTAAIAKCQTAGIQVIMVTGDQPLTAKAIAENVGIITKPEPGAPPVKPGKEKYRVVHGLELKDMEEKELQRILMTYPQIVFARTTPTQKLRIAECCKMIGHVVAMTGDGVNDAPALKAANIGVAMGIMGTQVAMQAADMILADDNFASIVSGIEEGRAIFDNLKKSIAYTLTSNIPEIMPFIVFVLLGFPLPLTTQLILAIDLGTDIFPAISFAYEPTELDIMKRKPRNAKHDRLVTTKLIVFSYLLIGVIQAAASFFCFFTVMYDFGFSAQGMMFLNTAKYHKFTDASGNKELQDVKWLDDDEGMLHLCGRWSNVALGTSSSDTIDAVPMSGRCSGPLFTLQDFDRYCHMKNGPTMTNKSPKESRDDRMNWYDSGVCGNAGAVPGGGGNAGNVLGGAPKICAKANATNLQKSVSNQGVVFKRDKDGLPDCSAAMKMPVTGVYLPYGVWSDDGQKRMDDAMKGQTCQFEDVRSSMVETSDGNDFVHVCYSADALKYAQSAYFVSMPMVQFSNMWFCKTRKLSLLHQGMRNRFMNFSVLGEIFVAVVLLYVPFMNILFKTRPVPIWHFMIPAMPFAVWIFIFDETRKFFLRQGDTAGGRAITGAKESAFGRWVYGHSYY